MQHFPNSQIKAKNLQLIREILWRKKKATHAKIAEESGLSVVTVGTLMRELLDNGEVLPEARISLGNGRPAQLYQFCYEYKLALALVMLERNGKDTLASIVLDLHGNALSRRIYPLGADSLHALCIATDEAVCMFPQIASIGIGIPGQAVHGKVVVGDRPDLLDVELEAFMKSKYHCDVMVENDVNAAAYAYAMRTHPDDEDCTAVVYFPLQHEPGAGILVGSRVLRGMNGMSGEIKGFPISIDWLNPPKPFELAMCEIARAITALLAPRHMLLYREGAQQEVLDMFVDAAWIKYDMPCRPGIVVSNSPADDYEQGIGDLALNKLLPWRM